MNVTCQNICHGNSDRVEGGLRRLFCGKSVTIIIISNILFIQKTVNNKI